MRKTTKSQKKIMFLANILNHHQIFNSNLVTEMARKGWSVLVVAQKDVALKLKGEHIKFIEWRVDRTGINPIRELRAFCALRQIMKQEQPNVVHNFTIKANVYGSLVAKMFSSAKIINTMNGLGYVYTESSLKSWIKRSAIKTLLLFSLGLSHVIIFMNKDDRNFFSKKLKKPKKVIVPGHGVDLHKFNRGTIPVFEQDQILKKVGIKNGDLVVTTAGRLIKQKGLIEFWQAAKSINKSFSCAKFIIIGMTDNNNPTKLSERELEEMSKDGLKILLDRKDVEKILSISDIFVLPSYREGGPQVIIEAMAMSLPVITTDVAGCRERVINGKSGILVQPKNILQLEKAMVKLLGNKNMRKKMGGEGRKLAEKYYSPEYLVHKVVSQYEK